MPRGVVAFRLILAAADRSDAASVAGWFDAASASRYITQARDGMVHPGDPSFAYGIVPQRNPRTFAGVDATGRACWSPSTGARSTSLVLHTREAAIAAAFVVWAVIAAVLAQTGRHQLSTITGIPRTVETAKQVPDALEGNEDRS